MKKRTWPIVILVIIFIVGLCIFLYPTVSNLLNQHKQSRVIENYEEQVALLNHDDYQDILDDAREYNSVYTKNMFCYTEDSETGTELYQSTLDIGGGVMGYLKIDKLNLRLPIYHGTSNSVLVSGVGHMPMTSLPVGGEGTHAVLSGHSGLPSAELLTKLDQMEIGDTFYICVLGEVLVYEVKEINTVLPDEMDILSIDEGEDKVSLVTCTPYGINTHRLIVTGYRVPYEDVVAKQEKENVGFSSPSTLVFYICVSVILIIILVILIRFCVKKRQRRGVKSDEKSK